MKIESGIKRVTFPTSNCFITAGEDKSVYVWKLENLKPILCHRTFHTNAITGICGLNNTSTVLSVGLDRQVIAYDFEKQMRDSKTEVKGQCLDIKANPFNPNLLMIQTK